MSRMIGGTVAQASACATGSGDRVNDHAPARAFEGQLGGGRVAGAAIIVGCVHV